MCIYIYIYKHTHTHTHTHTQTDKTDMSKLVDAYWQLFVANV